MTNTIVKVGRREFDYNTFTQAVQASKTYVELCTVLGMNNTVQTTINALKEAVKENGIDISHFTYKYVVSEALIKSAMENRKQFGIADINKKYYSAYEQSFDKITSWQQYKVHCGDYLESLGNNDFATITVEDLETYVDGQNAGENTKKNCKAHIRSMMIYIVKNNISGAYSKVSKEMLVYLI